MVSQTIEPKVVNIKNGWAAVGKGWAVFGNSKEDVIAKFFQAEQRHIEIESRTIEKPPQS